MRNTKELQHFYLRRSNIVRNKDGKEYPSNMRFGVVAIRKVDGGMRVSASVCSPNDVWDTSVGVNSARGKTLRSDMIRTNKDGTQVKTRHNQAVHDWVFVSNEKARTASLWEILVMLNEARAITIHYTDYNSIDHQKKFERALEDMMEKK